MFFSISFKGLVEKSSWGILKSITGAVGLQISSLNSFTSFCSRSCNTFVGHFSNDFAKFNNKFTIGKELNFSSKSSIEKNSKNASVYASKMSPANSFKSAEISLSVLDNCLLTCSSSKTSYALSSIISCSSGVRFSALLSGFSFKNNLVCLSCSSR